MFVSHRSILQEGISHDPDDDGEDDDERTKEQIILLQAFKLILEVAPGLLEHLNEASDQGALTAEFVEEIGAMLDDGRNDARRDDASSMKKDFKEWPTIDWSSDPCPRARHGRGFKNQVTGELLAPARVEWGDPQVREDFRTGRQIAHPYDYPSFLWPKGKYDRFDVSKDMFRGPVLVSAYIHIFVSRALAKGEAKSRRRGVARLHDISFVTFPSICYVATILRFSLSDVDSLTAGDPSDPREFPHEEFYQYLLECSEHFLPDEFRDLLDWWNTQIFPAGSSALPEPEPDSMPALMRAQAREKKRKRMESWERS